MGRVCDYHEMVEQMIGHEDIDEWFSEELKEAANLGGPVLANQFREELITAGFEVPNIGLADLAMCVEDYLQDIKDQVREHNEHMASLGVDPAKFPWRLSEPDEGAE